MTASSVTLCESNWYKIQSETNFAKALLHFSLGDILQKRINSTPERLTAVTFVCLPVLVRFKKYIIIIIKVDAVFLLSERHQAYEQGPE